MKVKQYHFCNCKKRLSQYHKQCKKKLLDKYLKEQNYKCTVCGFDLQNSKDESTSQLFIEKKSCEMYEKTKQDWILYFMTFIHIAFFIKLLYSIFIKNISHSWYYFMYEGIQFISIVIQWCTR